MPDTRKDVEVSITTKAQGDGVQKTDQDLGKLKKTVDGAQTSVDELESELKQAEKALKGADVGTTAFKKLQTAIRKTKADLKELKVGNLDARGIDRLSRRVVALRDRTKAAQSSLSDLKEEGRKPAGSTFIDRLKEKVSGLNGVLAKVPGGSKLAGLFSTITKGGVAATGVVGGLVAALASYFGLVATGIPKAAAIEDLTVSFETLLKSEDKAIARLEDLREFAVSTPLRLEGIAQSSRLLETLTDGALSTGDALRTLGDVAAGVQRPGETMETTFANVSLHAGRLFEALHSGNGQIGESILRLQELGIVSGSTRARIEALHKEGDRGTEAWAVLNEAFSRFDGNLEKRSKTLNGRLSTLADAWDRLKATAAEPFLEPVKAAITGTISLLGKLTGFAKSAAAAFGFVGPQAATSMREVETSVDAVVDKLIDLTKIREDAARAAAAQSEAIKKEYDDAIDRIDITLDREKELADLRKRKALAEVEADSTLSDADKAGKKADIEIQSIVDDHERELARKEFELQRALDAKNATQKELADAINKSSSAAREIELLSGQIEESQAVAKLVGEAQEALVKADKAQSRALELAQNPLRITGGLSGGAGTDDFRELETKSAEVAAARKALLDIENSRRESGIATVESIGEKVRKLEKEFKFNREIIDIIDSRDTSGSDSRIKALEDEIKFLKTRQAAELDVEEREANNTVSAAAEAEAKRISQERDRFNKTTERDLKKANSDLGKRLAELEKELAQQSEGFGDAPGDGSPRARRSVGVINASVRNVSEDAEELNRLQSLLESAVKTRDSNAKGVTQSMLSLIRASIVEINADKVRITQLEQQLKNGRN